MGNEHHHQFYHRRSTFLPMLCSRPSIKDVSLPRCRDHSIAFSSDPRSPRIGCMGQVKRNSRIVWFFFPTSHRLSSFTTKLSTASPVVKYSKLKKLFSGKNLSTSTAAPPPATVSGCGSRRHVTVNCCRKEACSSISIENMDPPLPVIKRVPGSEERSQVDNLWKRRSGGVALKTLPVQHTKNRLQPTPV